MDASVTGLDTHAEFPQALLTVLSDADGFNARMHEAAVQREARAALHSGSAWGEYLHKLLSPTAPHSTMRLLRARQA